jgi:LemA protein
MEFERDTLTQVMEARVRAPAATGPADAGRREGELTQALGRLFALAENYPTLRANENVKMLQEELTSTENKVGFARQFYNDIATNYNISQQTFPANMMASSFGFSLCRSRSRSKCVCNGTRSTARLHRRVERIA